MLKSTKPRKHKELSSCTKMLFIRGKVKKLTENTQEKVACKPASAVNRSRSPTAMMSLMTHDEQITYCTKRLAAQ